LDATIKIENPMPEMDIQTSEEKIELTESDPMDYIMGAKSPEIPSAETDPLDTIHPEPIEHELTLYRDQDVKLSISPDNTQVTVEALKDTIKITTENLAESEPIEDNDTNREPSVVEVESHNDSNKTSLFNRLVHEIQQEPPVEQARESKSEPQATQLPEVQVVSAQNQTSNQPEIEIAKETVISKPLLNEIKQSRGVIYYSGKSLIITGGVKVSPGDEVRINDKAFEVKRHPGHSRLFYIGVCGVGAVIILAALALMTMGSKDIGRLVGTITSGAEGRPLIGQGIKIAELNKTVSTNQAGFFIFDDIPAGIYTIDFQTTSGAHLQDRISVVKNQTTTIALRDRAASENVEAIPPPSQIETRPIDTTPKTDSRVSGKGTLRLAVTPSNASIYIDEKPLGVGSNSYKLDTGTYTLAVRKNGFEESRQQIKIDSDKTLNVKLSLAEAGPTSGSRIKTDSEAASEQETAGNYQEAMRYYDLALKKNSHDVGALLGKARCARAEGELDNATTFYMQAAKLAADKGDASSQLQALSGVIEMRPNTFTAYNSRGELLYNQGKYDKAAEDFTKVVEIDNRNLSAYYKLGDCFYKAGKYPDAINAFSAAQELNFADPKAGAWLTKTFLAMGDKKNAKKAYESFKETASYSTRLEFKRDPEWQKVLTTLGEKE
jgi:tetratricopeptide (TPR) repeat protein